ncbi:MAG: nucleotide exchange factor GrpE [bacterium]
MVEHEPDTPEPEEHDTESAERLDDEAPTEEHEPTASDTQEGELATVEVLADEIAELRARAAERDELLDKLQRTKADFINYQKRLRRERERWTEMAIEDFARSLLPVLDDLERARDAARVDHDPRALLKGVELIHAKLRKALEEHQVVDYEATGKQFDPAYHEAVAHIEAPDVPNHQVIEEVRRGYMMGDRVLRAAQVVVAKGGKPAPQPTSDQEEAQPDDADDASRGEAEPGGQ